MCAARVLSDFVDTVTIIERDAYPAAHDFRPGVPQACHVHNLLARGLREFESFFPGFERRMRECGKPRQHILAASGHLSRPVFSG